MARSEYKVYDCPSSLSGAVPNSALLCTCYELHVTVANDPAYTMSLTLRGNPAQKETTDQMMKAIANIENGLDINFTPVTLTIDTPTKLANLVGALMAYGVASVYAENQLKTVGLGGYYSGNVRAAARDMASAVLAGAGLPEPQFEINLKGQRKSKAGEFVLGTKEDRAPGKAATSFEPVLEVEADDDDVVDDEPIVIAL